MAEREIEHQLELATELSVTSQVLSLVMPEGRTYHVRNPRFKKPSISLGGYDISPILYQLAQDSQELIVSFHTQEVEYDGDDYNPPYYVWEISPPKCSSFIGRFYSDCFQDVDMQGLGLTVFCPQLNTIPSREELEFYKAYGALNVDLLFWSEYGERFYDRTKPASVLLDTIEHHHKTESLEIALWVLQSLQNAEEIHPERWCFEL